jgi:hypothetical protein
MDLPPALRTNIDYVFCLRENIIQNREKLYKSFFGVFPTFAMFQQVLDACTENYECLVIDNTSHSAKLEDCIFWYKADTHADFRIGAPEFWNHSASYMMEKDEEPYDPRAGLRLRGPAINVRKTT